MQASQVFDYLDDDLVARVRVRRANFMDNFVHDQMVGDAINLPAPEAGPRAVAMRTVAIVIWPAVIAVTEDALLSSTDGTVIPWPVTVEQFCAFPPALVNQWMSAIWDLNPDWAPGREPEKKA